MVNDDVLIRGVPADEYDQAVQRFFEDMSAVDDDPGQGLSELEDFEDDWWWDDDDEDEDDQPDYDSDEGWDFGDDE